MRKVLIYSGVGLILLMGVLYAGVLQASEPLPKGKPSAEADTLAKEMMTALNKEAWDSTASVSWTFKGVHHYVWDKENKTVTVAWDDHEVLLKPDEQSGEVKNGAEFSTKKKDKLVSTAIDYFNNDSFWLCAPFKAFDPGTVRSIVTLKDGREGLMVTYTSGGSTPGDSYVWILDEKNRPTEVKMWVAIIPIKGIAFSWENYVTLSSGAMLAQDHWLRNWVNVELNVVE